MTLRYSIIFVINLKNKSLKKYMTYCSKITLLLVSWLSIVQWNHIYEWNAHFKHFDRIKYLSDNKTFIKKYFDIYEKYL